MEIVYCGDCGKSLRRDDFLQGRAGYQNDIPYCVECRPAVQAASAPPLGSGTHRKLSTSRIPRPAVPPTARLKSAPAPPPERSRLPLILGGTFGGACLAVLLLVVIGRGGREEGGTAPPPSGGTARGAGKESPALPVPSPAGEEARRREEERIREERRRREEEERRKWEQEQVEGLLAEAKAVREADPKFAQSGKVRELYRSAAEKAGARRPEVERILAEYERAVEEDRRKALSRRKGPYALSPAGYIQNWLIAGPFPNPEDKGFYVDYLRTEEEHQPAEGVEIPQAGKAVRWAPYFVEGGWINFFRVPHLGLSDGQPFVIQYCACWLECDGDMDVEIRLGSDDGFRLWLDGELRMGAHIHRAVREDDDVGAVRLTRGLHLLLIKVDQGEGDHGLAVRVVTPAGERPAGLRVWN